MRNSVEEEDLSTPRLTSAEEAGQNPSSDESDTRINVRLAPRVAQALEWITTVAGISKVDAIRTAIGTERFFLELQEKGAKIYVKMPDEKELKQVIFKT